jgi:hypothetical protein
MYEGLRDLYAAYSEGTAQLAHEGSWRRDEALPWDLHFDGRAFDCRIRGIGWRGCELFRAIDVNAIRKGQTTIFDLAPPELDSLAELQELRNALAECHGTAWTVYIEHLD